MNAKAKPILQAKDLTTSLRIGKAVFNVVDGLSFDLQRGRTLALVGESGCGKTMAALSIMRVLPSPPALLPRGEVLYQQKNLLVLPEREMRKIRGADIAMIFQDPANALNPVYSIGNQLMEVAGLHLGIYGEEALERVVKALEEVRIPSPLDRLNDYPHQLSGGMKQRVMIAMALMCEPDILIADEPTTALDVTIQIQVLQLIQELQAKKGMAVLLITHDMGVVAEIADDVMVMYATQAAEKGSAEQIFDQMSHPYTQGLFQSRPTTHSSKGVLPQIRGMVPSITQLPAGCRFHPRCPYVMEKCKQGHVPDFVVEEENHLAKCWLHDKTPESEENLAKKRKDATSLV